MRRALDTLYESCAWFAGACMVAIFVTIMIQVAGSYVGLYVRGTDAIAGYFMAGASFLALASTLKRGEHIRVALVLERLPPAWRRGFEVACLAAAVALTAAFAWYSWTMAWWSYQFNAISDAQDRTPLWFPQLAMGLGVTVLAVAFVDELVAVARGRAPAAAAAVDGPARTE